MSSKDFKTKYFEKAKTKPKRDMFTKAFGDIRLETFDDLFPLINEMREALEFYGDSYHWHIDEYGNSIMDSYTHDDEETFEKIKSGEKHIGGKRARHALKNLDDFVGGGE